MTPFLSTVKLIIIFSYSQCHIRAPAAPCLTIICLSSTTEPQPAPLPVLRPTNEELERWTRPALAALTINAPPPHAQPHVQPVPHPPAPQPQPQTLAVKYHTHCVFSPLLLHP